jgi:hypothetical protein
MKVIGKDEQGNYIAVVGHRELQKVCDKYYGREELKELKIGQELNLGDGHDFRAEIQAACKQMVDASEKFGRAQKTLFEFAQMVNKIPVGLEPPATDKATA